MDQVDIWVMPSYSYHKSGTCTTHSPEALVLLQLVIAIAFTKVPPTTPAAAVDDYRVDYPVNTTDVLAFIVVMAAISVCERVCVCLRGSTYPPSHGKFSDSKSIPHFQNVLRGPSLPPLMAASLPPSKSRRGLLAEKQPNLGPRRISTLLVPTSTLSPCETSTRSLKLRKEKNKITYRFTG